MVRSFVLAVLAAASLALIGCTDPSGGEDPEENLAAARDAILSGNGLSANGLSANGLSANGLSANGLSANGLSANGLSANGLSANGALMSVLTDGVSQKILRYVVSCALPVNESFTLTINGYPTTFNGALGLAPEWGGDDGSCDSDCQSWVSGCLLSRLNYEGDTVPLSLRGSAEALVSEQQEMWDFPAMEATYFGDLFANPPRLFACKAHGSNLIERVCGPSINDCALEVLGDCDDYFMLDELSTSRCGMPDQTEGSYPDCRDDDGNTYPGSITVYRQCGNQICDDAESADTCPEDCS